MSFTPPAYEPLKVTQGDTIEWTKTLPSYSPGTYTLKYALRGPKKIDLTATTSGTSFKVTVAASASALWLPGTYYWQAYVEAGSEKYTVGNGQMEVLRSLTSVTDENYDGRSRVKIALDCIEAVLTKRATRQQEEYEIDGVRIKDKPLSELLGLRDHYTNLYKQELSQMQIENGRPGRRKILTRFVR